MPTIKLYHFPQVGLYLSIVYPGDGYGYVILNDDGYITELSSEVDYVKDLSVSSSSFSLVMKPGHKDTIYINASSSVVSINSKKFYILPVDPPASLIYENKIVYGDVSAYLPKAEFFEIGIGDYLDSVTYRNTGENAEYMIAKPEKIHYSFIFF